MCAPYAGKSSSAPARIMLVEDNGDLRESIAGILAVLGHVVVAFPDGEEALQGFCREKNDFSLLITDVMLPGINGDELAMKIRRKKKEIKILFISGFTGNIIDRDGFLKEGVEFLKKPFTAKDLAERINSLLL